MSDVNSSPAAEIPDKPNGKTLASLWNGTANVCGVLGLVIGVAWTFPSEIWEAYFSSQVKMEEGVKEAIVQMASVYKEFALSQGANLNDQARFMLNSIAIVQISYHLDKISKYPDEIFARSSYFENLALAGLAYQVQRYDDALRFNKSAIIAADREKIEPLEAYTGIANATTGRDGASAIQEARESYKLALRAGFKRQKTGRADYAMAPLSVMIDASLTELKIGSWECGNTLAGLVELQLTKPEMKTVAMAQTALSVFKSIKATITPVAGRSAFACDYFSSLN